MSNTASMPPGKTAKVVEVRESLVLIEVDEQTPIAKNEVGYVCVGDERLKAEVLRIRGRTADMQVFEDTSGVRVGDRVEMTGEMLSATLGPGLLGGVFDGLQNPLAALAEQYGFFLPRGVAASPLDLDRTWRFAPQVKAGDRVLPGRRPRYRSGRTVHPQDSRAVRREDAGERHLGW